MIVVVALLISSVFARHWELVSGRSFVRARTCSGGCGPVVDKALLVSPPEIFVRDIDPSSGSDMFVLQVCDEVVDVVAPSCARSALFAVGWTLF